jgi:hypothetical protein
MKECEECGSTDRVQGHHIIHGRGKRKACETNKSVIDLCWEHHHGDYGVHGKNGHEFDMQLKLRLQLKYFEMGKPENEVMELMGGRLYLKDGEVYGNKLCNTRRTAG